MATFLLVAGIVIVAGILLAAVAAWPILRLLQQRAAAEQSRRLAEMRLQRLTAQALQQMMQEARTRR